MTSMTIDNQSRELKVIAAIDFILAHSQQSPESLFPRTIMTASTPGQVVVNSREEIFARFRAANYKDCRINAFPHLVGGGHNNNNTCWYPANFIFIDLDMQDFDNDLDKVTAAAEKVCQRIKEVFGDKVVPTVLWTGGGYHVYLPLSGNIIPEKYDVFSEFADWWRTHECKDLTSVFMAFAERFLTGGKSDKGHTPTIKSCLLRVPYTFNVKYDDEVNQVLIINSAYKCGDEVFTDVAAPEMAAVQYILQDFRYYLFDHRAQLGLEKLKQAKKQVAAKNKSKKQLEWMQIKARRMGMVVNKRWIEAQQQQQEQQKNRGGGGDNNTTWWIERLLQIGIGDFRKRAVSLILVPYFLHKRHLQEEQAADIIRAWLTDKCAPVKRLNFKPNTKIKEALHYSKQSKILHMKFDTLKEQNPDLHHRLQEEKREPSK